MFTNYSLEDLTELFPYKVELHVHLDGAVRPETVLAVAKNKGAKLSATDVESLKEQCVVRKPGTLATFLQRFDAFGKVFVGDKDAITRMAYEFCEDCAKQNIRYVETRFCPSTLASKDGKFTSRDVVTTICDTLKRGAKDFNIRVNSILCCLTTKPEFCSEIVELCKEFKDNGVVGLDVAGLDFTTGQGASESPIKLAFHEAHKSGIHRTVHAGENGPPEGVKEALDDMFAERIGHGYHVTEDPELYARCRKEQVHLEICPISSICTGSCPKDLTQHPLLRFCKDGFNFSLNTDDPIITDSNITKEYAVARAIGLSNDDIIKSIFNAARSCFASEETKKEILKELEEVYGPH